MKTWLWGLRIRAALAAGLAAALLAAACGAKPAADSHPTLTVFAAASLAEAFTEIGSQFEAANPPVRVIYNFAGSQQLAQQIVQGAPADVFASASQSQMQAAIQSGRIITSSVQIFASNELAIITPASNPAGVATMGDLAKPGLKLILAASSVPAGQYAIEFLSKAAQDPSLGAGYAQNVQANVVSYEENVRAVLSKVSLGEADAGIVYRSDVTSASQGKVRVIEIPPALNVLAYYPAAPLADSAQPVLASAFVEYLLSPASQEILSRYGFKPAQ